jgi:3-oxoacyl-[acyl-carrier protein] reductase
MRAPRSPVINAAALERAVQALRAPGRTVVGHPADIANPAEVTSATTAARSSLGGLDILVNNAGFNAPGTVEQLDIETWNRVLAVNLTGFFLMTKAVWSGFVRQKHGVVLNMSSIMGLTGARDSIAYCTCKAAIVAFTKSLAADGGPFGIRSNCICPGYVHTKGMDDAHSPAMQARLAAQIPVRRMARAEEIADGFAYLASDQATYVNGAVLVMDGAATVGFAGCYLE